MKEKAEQLNKAGTNNAAFKGQKQARSVSIGMLI